MGEIHENDLRVKSEQARNVGMKTKVSCTGRQKVFLAFLGGRQAEREFQAECEGTILC